jgi:hypothetical protein
MRDSVARKNHVVGPGGRRAVVPQVRQHVGPHELDFESGAGEFVMGFSQCCRGSVDTGVQPEPCVGERALNEPRVAAAQVEQREGPRMTQKHIIPETAKDRPVAHPVVAHDRPVNVPLVEPPGSFCRVVRRLVPGLNVGTHPLQRDRRFRFWPAGFSWSPASADNRVAMPAQTFLPGPHPNTVRTHSGQTLAVPVGWMLLPPGDAALTRRVKAAGEFWMVQERVGRKIFSRGVWAPREVIEQIQRELAAERSTDAYSRRREADSKRREAKQAEYVEDFHAAVLAFLAFHERYAMLAQSLARAVAAHATPVGSGTVARTQRIPIERRAEAAVIAWMRHQTTAYDSMRIPRVKGKRREVRRMLAERSREVLANYRRGEPLGPACPLSKALVLDGQLKTA